MMKLCLFAALALTVAAQDADPPPAAEEVIPAPPAARRAASRPHAPFSDPPVLATLAQAAAADGEAAEAEPIRCPVGGGGFQELYAVAVLLSHQDKLEEAEVCLSDAITTTVPAYRMLSDIATVNSQFGRAAAIAEIIETLTNNGE